MLKDALNPILYVNIFIIIFESVNYFENVAPRKRNVGELLLNFIRVFLSLDYYFLNECDDVKSSNFELCFHLHFASMISSR